MNREEFTLWINDLEQKYPVNEWQINSVHLWPLIKIKLSFYLESTSKRVKKDSQARKVKNITGGALDLLSIWRKEKPEIPADLYCLAPHFRYNDGERNVNRYFNQLIAEVEKSPDRDFYLMDYGNTTSSYRDSVDFPAKTFFSEGLKYLALAIRTGTWRFYFQREEWVRFNEFIIEVEGHLGVRVFDKRSIIKQFVYVDILKKIYKKFLRKYKINNVYILCYYVSEMYAMNLAAADLGINYWDIQHGGQGKLHLAYTGFNKVPSTGYKLLPKNFWCWDSASTSELSKWISTQKYHMVWEKGNPWITHCLEKYPFTVAFDKKIILYTMQPLGDTLLEDYIIDTIKNTPDSFTWWLRMHPRQLARKGEFQKLLEDVEIIDKVELDLANSLPLPGILSRTHIHVSKYSGSILEAHTMGVKNVIISPVGVQSFPEVVKSGNADMVLGENSKELLKHITQLAPKVNV